MDSLSKLKKTVGDRLLVTSRRYWKYFDENPVDCILVKEQVTEEIAKNMAESLTKDQMTKARANGIVGFGGGKVMDYAKCVYDRSLAPALILFPGTITTDAPWTNSYGIRDFENKKIRYKKISYGWGTIIDYDLLVHIYKTELGLSPTNWAICELFSHFTSTWEAINIQGKSDPGEDIDVIAEELNMLSTMGSKDWFMELTALFEFSIQIQNDYGVEYQEGSEHYIAYYDELINGTSGPHGKLLANGIDFVLTYQNNKYLDLWNELRKRYYLSVDEIKIDNFMLKSFLEENKFRKNLLEDII